MKSFTAEHAEFAGSVFKIPGFSALSAELGGENVFEAAMGFTIAVAGKGGTGKTSLCGLTIRYLTEKKKGRCSRRRC